MSGDINRINAQNNKPTESKSKTDLGKIEDETKGFRCEQPRVEPDATTIQDCKDLKTGRFNSIWKGEVDGDSTSVITKHNENDSITQFFDFNNDGKIDEKCNLTSQKTICTDGNGETKEY